MRGCGRSAVRVGPKRLERAGVGCRMERGPLSIDDGLVWAGAPCLRGSEGRCGAFCLRASAGRDDTACLRGSVSRCGTVWVSAVFLRAGAVRCGTAELPAVVRACAEAVWVLGVR